MKRGFLALCLVASLFPVTALAAAPDFAETLTSFLTDGKPSNFHGTVLIKSTDADVKLTIRGAGEEGKLPKSWIAFDVRGKVQGQIIDLSVELRFKNDTAYIRVDDARPDFFFSRWEGVKGKWYALPTDITDDDVQAMLPSFLNADVAGLASMLDVIVTRFKTGYSFAFTAPALHASSANLSGKIDSSTDNQYRFASIQFGWTQADTTVSADFKAQRQFSSVYVETPRGNLRPFPAFSAEQRALLNGAGGEWLSAWLWASDEEQPMTEPEIIAPGVKGAVTTEPVTVGREEVQTVVVPQGSLTIRSRESRQLPGDRASFDRAAIRNRQHLNAARSFATSVSTPNPGNERLMAFATSLAAEMRGADVGAVIASGTAATLSMKNLYALLANAERGNPGTTYLYIVAPAGGADAFRLLVDNYTLLSKDLLDLDKNGIVDADEKPAVPGTVYVNPLYTRAMKMPIVDVQGGERIVYVPVRDGAGNVLAVLAVSTSLR